MHSQLFWSASSPGAPPSELNNSRPGRGTARYPRPARWSRNHAGREDGPVVGTLRWHGPAGERAITGTFSSLAMIFRFRVISRNFQYAVVNALCAVHQLQVVDHDKLHALKPAAPLLHLRHSDAGAVVEIEVCPERMSPASTSRVPLPLRKVSGPELRALHQGFAESSGKPAVPCPFPERRRPPGALPSGRHDDRY